MADSLKEALDVLDAFMAALNRADEAWVGDGWAVAQPRHEESSFAACRELQTAGASSRHPSRPQTRMGQIINRTP